MNKTTLLLSLFSISIMTFQIGCAGSSSNYLASPVSYWKLNSDAKDIGGSSNNGTWSGTATYSTGKLGNAADFDGMSYINCGDSPTNLPSGSADRSFTAWVKPSVSGQSMSIIGWGNDSGGLLSEILIKDTNKLEFHGQGNDVTGSTTITSGVWTFVAVTIKDQHVKLYVNGVLDATEGDVTLSTTAANCKIGRQPDYDGQNFRGLIDEVGVWKKALTETEITYFYNNGSGISY